MSTTPLQISNSVPGYKAKLSVASGTPPAVTAITAAATVGTTATLTAAFGANPPAIGATVAVAGVTPAGYNGNLTVLTSSPTQFTATVAAGLGAGTVFGTVTVNPPINFGELDEIDFTKTRDMLDATSHDANGAKIKKPGLIDWNATAKGLHLATDITQKAVRAALDGSTPLYITVYPEGIGTGNTVQTGACYVKDFKFSAAVKDLAKADFSLEGSGFLVESVQ
jgi:hypothetical protein